MNRLSFLKFCLLTLSLVAPLCHAAEDLIDTARTVTGETIPYILNHRHQAARYALILFPGGHGAVDPHMRDGQLSYSFRGNFLLRARRWIVDDEFVTATTNSTQLEERIQAVIDDLQRRFPSVQIYLVGTSRGTFDTVKLADYLSDKIAGEIHTSSLAGIASLNPRKYRNRHLLVHHRQDACRSTPFGAAQASHERFGTDLVAMEGGVSVGDACEPFSYHGFNGVERETVDAIKQWVRQGARTGSPP